MNINSRVQAEKKVAAIKKWYKTIPLFIVATIVLLVLTYIINTDPDVPNFIFYVLWLGPTFWWFYVLIQGLNIFGYLPKFINNWEEDKIEQIIKKDVKQAKWE